MPLPLIPAILLGSSVLAGMKGIYDAVTAGMEIPALQEKYNERRVKYDYVESVYDKHRCRVDYRLRQLGRLRLDALVTLGTAVAFLKKARIRERELFEAFHISQEQLEEWEGASLHALDMLNGVVRSAGAGVATATGTIGLVGAFGAASTGTAIASLSGAAATNATLAWLGGGALAAGGGGMALGTVVLGGLVAGPALLVGGFFLNRKIEEVRTEVARQLAEMDVAEAHMKQQYAEFKAIGARIDEVDSAIRQAQCALQNGLTTAYTNNIEDVFMVAKLAQALAAILDVKVIAQTDIKVQE